MKSHEESDLNYGILVHCHLRWDFVWQRPQHIMSRLSKHHPVLFLEDAAPLPEGETEPRFALTHVSPTLTVARPLLVPQTGSPEKDAEADRINAAAWQRLLDTTVHSLKWDHLAHWFYTPMASDARTLYNPVGICYDCMDELANFKGAPEGIRQREVDLMAAADVVFTGGPSMYQARKDKHPNVHQFNSGVDVEHFRLALAPETVVPDDIATLAHPILLYYGVIDERMGWDYLAAVADAHPDWNIVLVGPLAKITDADLLKRPNIHYTGQRGYKELPGYLKGADIALVPFALTDATRFLSPTKTLEYFAARKPVVSTPIQDIVDNYADAARIAATPAEFVTACEAALADRDSNDTIRLDRGEAYAESQTWDKIVEQMHAYLDAAVEKHLGGATESADGQELETGQVRWYSGSRGVGHVDVESGEGVLAFLPGAVQESLGGVQEGQSVALGSAGPSHTGHDHSGTNMFPLGLDRLLEEESAQKQTSNR